MKFIGYCITLLLVSLVSFGDVVINEIDYDPLDLDNNPGGFREFIELYNPGPDAVDLSGYAFTNGIYYEFPQASNSRWRNQPYPVLGPYEGKLSNDGERIELQRADGTTVERIRYDNDHPWPRGADGYGFTLERISWDLPGNDFHSWRTSLTSHGTPGARNSVVGTLPRPIMLAHEIYPAHPTSIDDVRIRVGLDAPSIIESVALLVERAESNVVNKTIFPSTTQWKYWKGTSRPSPGLEWTTTDFDDSAWGTGPGGFGYSNEAIERQKINTTLADMSGRYTTVYIRKTFTVESPASLGSLALHIHIDDGFICFVNGRQVASFNAPSSFTHTSTSIGSGDFHDLQMYEMGSASTLLQTGENVVALVGFNASLSNSSDFVLSPSLISTTVPGGSSNDLPMQIIAESPESATFEATVSPTDSQTLVRFNVEVKLKSGETVLLPHNAEMRPFESYFVYDGEIESTLPLMWIFENQRSRLPETTRSFTGAVFVHPAGTPPQVFDGVRYLRSENGNKIKFLKGEEYRGDRTININPETPTSSGNAGETGPSREYLGFWFFRYFGLLAPRVDWYHTIENTGTSSEQHTIRLVVQQVNERMLDMNGRDPDSDLYKLEHNTGFVKHTNRDESSDNIQELRSELTRNLTNQNRLRDTIYSNLDVEVFLTYSVVSVLMSNWDGFFNNNWMYLNPPEQEGENGIWEIIPWDLDKTWGDTDADQQFYEMPVDYPLDGKARLEGRRPGDITGPFHRYNPLHEEYKMRLRYALDREFADGAPIWDEIDRVEAQILEEIDIMDRYTQKNHTKIRNQTQFSWMRLREFIGLRRGYLDPRLPEPVPVMDWTLY